MNFIKSVSIAIIVIGVFFSCKSNDSKKSNSDTNTKSISIRKYETPPGADPEVSAELGGNGFKGDGWITNKKINIIGNPNAVKGGSLVMSMSDFPVTLRNVGKDNNSYITRMAAILMYEGLLKYDHVTLEYVPCLATHWKISEDKKIFSFRINPDARWADGKPVTARDVIDTWKLNVDSGIISPQTNEIFKNYYEPAEESKYIVTVRVKKNESDWRTFGYFCTLNILPSHYINGLSGKDYLEKYQFEVIPGSGPYCIELSKIKKGVSITFNRLSDYWAANDSSNLFLFNFDEIRYDVISDQKLEFEKFKKGEIDALSFTPITKVDQWEDGLNIDKVKRGIIQKTEVYNDCPTGVRGFVLNIRKPPFDDIRIRKAFAHLLNRELILKKLYRNAAELLHSYFSNSDYENPGNIRVNYDFNKSVQLLREAGYDQKNSEGFLIKNGKILEVDLIYSNPALEKMLTIYQEDLRSAGIKLNLRQVDGATNFKLGNERNFSMITASWLPPSSPDPELTLSTKSANEINSTNWAGIADPKIDSLIIRYNNSHDRNERVKIFREIDKIATDYFAYILTWNYPAERVAFHNKFGYPPGMFTRTGNILTLPWLWYIDPELNDKYKIALDDETVTSELIPYKNVYWREAGKKLRNY